MHVSKRKCFAESDGILSPKILLYIGRIFRTIDMANKKHAVIIFLNDDWKLSRSIQLGKVDCNRDVELFFFRLPFGRTKCTSFTKESGIATRQKSTYKQETRSVTATVLTCCVCCVGLGAGCCCLFLFFCLPPKRIIISKENGKYFEHKRERRLNVRAQQCLRRKLFAHAKWNPPRFREMLMFWIRTIANKEYSYK